MNGDRIQGSTIEGVAIALDTIQTRKYPVSRPLFFYAKKAHIGAIPGMQDYLNEFVSESAVWEYGYLSDIGLVPLEPQQLAEIRKRIKNLTTL
jgi:phosphate transport system substrate-binding protein